MTTIATPNIDKVNKMREKKLSELEDYVFLSDRNTQTNYVVERDGRIWLSDAFPLPYFERAETKIVLNWRDYIPGQVRWNWRKDYLPVLEILDNENLLELTADEGELLLRYNEDECFSYPGRQKIDNERFARMIEGKDAFWKSFFSSGWQPPENPLFPDAAWRACFVQAMHSFCGSHPKYGVGYYNRNYHDGFPPTIISMVNALLDYHHPDIALDYLGYYFDRFVLADGSIDYYGPALSEYGMLLDLSGKIIRLPEGRAWLENYYVAFHRIARYLYRIRNPFVYGTDRRYRLLAGVPEADTRDAPAVYVHNNAWVWRGLISWRNIAANLGRIEDAEEAKREACDLKIMLDKAISENLMPDGLIPARLDRLDTIHSFTDSRDCAYANNRYYLELLHSGFLSRDDENKLIEARESRDGELAGMTYFHFAAAWGDLPTAPYCCNNWPIASYGAALARLGEKARLERVIKGHLHYHLTHDTFTAYENVDAQVEGVRRAFTDWCVPAQLAYPRMLKWYVEMPG